jgi:hypothetical protein
MQCSYVPFAQNIKVWAVNVIGGFMFWNNKQVQIEKRAAIVLRNNLELSSDFQRIFTLELSKNFQGIFTLNNSLLIKLEMYTYLNTWTDVIMSGNNVDRDIRQLFFNYSWNTLSNKQLWPNLNIEPKKLDKYCDDRTKNYADLFIKHKQINAKYIEEIIFYQTQLFSSIVKKNELSFFKLKYDPIELDAMFTWLLNVTLQEFFINILLPSMSNIRKNLVNDYFTNKNYKMKD